jgi:hypothetical protein
MGEYLGVQQNPRAHRPAHSSYQAAHTSTADNCHNSVAELSPFVSPDCQPNCQPNCRPNCRPKLGSDVCPKCRPNLVSSNCLPNVGSDGGPIGVPDHVSDAGAHCELVSLNILITLRTHYRSA